MILLAIFLSISINAQSFNQWRCNGMTTISSKDSIKFTIIYTVAYEVSERTSSRLFRNNEDVFEKKIKSTSNSKLAILFTEYSAEELITGIQDALNNSNFIDALTNETISAIMNGLNTQETPEFKILWLKISKISPL